jgi:hypothetical protein
LHGRAEAIAGLRRADTEGPTLPNADPGRPRLPILLVTRRRRRPDKPAEAEGIVNTPDSSQRCAWCDGPLPAPVEGLAVVQGRDGEMLVTCSTDCLAALVAALAGPSDEWRHLVGR